ncbi:hypothetical protein [Candidatus Sarmatiella mevalonica]|uniref:hypothetical protein n=1 Tax=Candidatus Sarmatiella mevalonica TaxID=2770581 RepID=UPI00192387AF|nr:hypothetical protein [Candidatus Sarmatiella mevalonica]
MHNLFRGVILLSKLLCAPHILEYAAVLNIIFPKNSSFIFRLCNRSIIKSYGATHVASFKGVYLPESSLS